MQRRLFRFLFILLLLITLLFFWDEAESKIWCIPPGSIQVKQNVWVNHALWLPWNGKLVEQEINGNYFHQVEIEDTPWWWETAIFAEQPEISVWPQDAEVIKINHPMGTSYTVVFDTNNGTIVGITMLVCNNGKLYYNQPDIHRYKDWPDG